MTEARATASTPVGPKTSANVGKVTYMYVGYQESGEWDTFSDELEAHRYAIKGASKVRVEKRELKKRAK